MIETKLATDRQARTDGAPLLSVENVDFWYGDNQALFNIELAIHPREIIAFMGPSGCGKSTLIKLFNRMQDTVPGARMAGRILLEGEDIYAPEVDPVAVRRRFGWVAQAPNPFPVSVRENIAYGPRIHGLVEEGPEMDAHVRNCLERANLWDEIGDRLDEHGTALSGGQQQRLCIARALSIMPDMLLMDEPCSSIDPIATAKIEALVLELKRETAIVIITHNLQQAQRLADRVAFFYLGRLVEHGAAQRVFNDPKHIETQRYLAGKFG